MDIPIIPAAAAATAFRSSSAICASTLAAASCARSPAMIFVLLLSREVLTCTVIRRHVVMVVFEMRLSRGALSKTSSHEQYIVGAPFTFGFVLAGRK